MYLCVCVHVYTCTMIYVRLGQVVEVSFLLSSTVWVLAAFFWWAILPALSFIYLLFSSLCVCVLSVYQCADPCTCLGGKGADWHALRYCCPPQFWDRISIPFCFSVAVMNHSDLEAAWGGKGYFIFQLTIGGWGWGWGDTTQHKAGVWVRLMGKYWLLAHSQACFWAHG